MRAGFAGTVLVGSVRAMVMREDGHAPVFYFPHDDASMDLLTRSSHASH